MLSAGQSDLVQLLLSISATYKQLLLAALFLVDLLSSSFRRHNHDIIPHEQGSSKPQTLGLHLFPSAQQSACKSAKRKTGGETTQRDFRQQSWQVTDLYNQIFTTMDGCQSCMYGRKSCSESRLCDL